MKIKTKLKLTVIATIAVLVWIICSYWWVKKQTAFLDNQEEIIRNLSFEVFQSNQIRDEYFIYKTERAKQQWFALDKKITEQFYLIASLITDVTEKKELERLLQYHKNIAGLFKKLISYDQADSASDASEISKIIISQMIGESHLLYQQCIKLTKDTDRKAEKQMANYGTFNLISLGLLGMIVVMFARLAMKNVTDPLLRLKEGTRIISGGNFDYRLTVGSSDEIGELAADFNLMTEQLATITVSRDELQREIEKRILTEEKLRESNILLEQSFEQTPIPLVLVSMPDAILRIVNPACQRFLGIEDEPSWINTPLKSFKPSFQDLDMQGRPGKLEDLPLVRCLMGQKTESEERCIVRKDGTIRYELASATPIFDDDNRIIAGYLILMDITERKLAEKQLQDKNAELERFAYTVSHDLKSPLITIQSYAGMILKDMEAGNSERAHEDMKRIEGAASKMTALLNDLLELSRIGRAINQKTLVDMNSVVHDALMQLAGAVKQSQVEVVVYPALPSAFGDQSRIAEVVQNLIENAIKYMGDQVAPRIEIGARQDANGCIFYVLDNGKGIEPRFQEKIFGLFNKLDGKSEGTGVGLALVKRIIEVHGGQVWVESEGLGKGSCFCFMLPGVSEGGHVEVAAEIRRRNI